MKSGHNTNFVANNMPQLENSQTPVTAVSFHDGILLAADGPFLRLYDETKKTLLESHRIFDWQQIHGISISDSEGFSNHAIIWGGKLLRTSNLSRPAYSELTYSEKG